MIYFGEDEVFSVELPTPKFISLKQYDKGLDEVEVYRYAEKEMTDEDVKVLKGLAERIISTKQKYDIGQLLGILIGVINGYYYKYNPIFDAGKKNLVCSVGVATIYNAWRKWLKIKGEEYRRLFTELNPEAWSEDFRDMFLLNGRWDVESIMPAHFSNTHTHFRGEFRYIGKFVNGNLINKD
jgi:hypothetical protein